LPESERDSRLINVKAKIFCSIKSTSRRTWSQQDAQALLDGASICIISVFKTIIKKKHGNGRNSRDSLTPDTESIHTFPYLLMHVTATKMAQTLLSKVYASC